jgi:hypothetical protein
MTAIIDGQVVYYGGSEHEAELQIKNMPIYPLRNSKQRALYRVYCDA